MKNIIIGLYLMFSFPTIIYFWVYMIYLEKTKQINLEGLYDKKCKK